VGQRKAGVKWRPLLVGAIGGRRACSRAAAARRRGALCTLRAAARAAGGAEGAYPGTRPAAHARARAGNEGSDARDPPAAGT
jgi:hypothetical protein